jgi:hypothetical protein
MGAWGFGIYDNDTAMDCVAVYEDYLKEGNTVNEAIQKLKSEWFIKENWSILAIVDLQVKNLKYIDDDIKALVNKTIIEEMALIKEWTEPDKRKIELKQFYNSIKHLL